MSKIIKNGCKQGINEYLYEQDLNELCNNIIDNFMRKFKKIFGSVDWGNKTYEDVFNDTKEQVRDCIRKMIIYKIENCEIDKDEKISLSNKLNWEKSALNTKKLNISTDFLEELLYDVTVKNDEFFNFKREDVKVFFDAFYSIIQYLKTYKNYDFLIENYFNLSLKTGTKSMARLSERMDKKQAWRIPEIINISIFIRYIFREKSKAKYYL